MIICVRLEISSWMLDLEEIICSILFSSSCTRSEKREEGWWARSILVYQGLIYSGYQTKLDRRPGPGGSNNGIEFQLNRTRFTLGTRLNQTKEALDYVIMEPSIILSSGKPQAQDYLHTTLCTGLTQTEGALDYVIMEPSIILSSG